MTPDAVSILVDGKVARTGGKELAIEIEENGFKDYGVTEEKEVSA